MDPEEAHQQGGGQQLPHKEDEAKHQVAFVPQVIHQVRLWESRGLCQPATVPVGHHARAQASWGPGAMATKEVADVPNAHLVRDVVPVVIEGIKPAPGGQSQGRQVVAGPTGIEQDHGTTHRSRLAHTGPLAQMTTGDPQGGEAPASHLP